MDACLDPFFGVDGWLVLEPFKKSVGWIPGLFVFMMDYERSWVFGLSEVTSGGPPWVRISASHVFGVWFALRTICEGCNSLPVTNLRPFCIKKKIKIFVSVLYSLLESARLSWMIVNLNGSLGFFPSTPVVVPLWQLSESHLRGEPCTAPCLPAGTLSFGARFALGHSI